MVVGSGIGSPSSLIDCRCISTASRISSEVSANVAPAAMRDRSDSCKKDY